MFDAVSQDFLPFTRPSIDEATIAGVAEVLRSGWITSGPQVREFEAQLSEYFGGRPVRALSSATGGMEIGLALLGVGAGRRGDHHAAVLGCHRQRDRARRRATGVRRRRCAHAQHRSVAASRRAITPRTRALLPVDLAGLPVDRTRLNAIARRHKLRVLEDAAQSMGASWDGRAHRRDRRHGLDQFSRQ